MKVEAKPCLCGSGLGFEDCCGRYINGNVRPATAEQLMRSRYCAYVLRDSDYLLQTWHETTRPDRLELDADTAVKWLGLKVLSTEAGGVSDNSARVEFVARYKLNGKAVRLHERSRFERLNEQWFYVDGRVE